MPEQPGAGRLEPEVLAAYIDGLLPPEERARVEAEIAADPETYEWVVNSINAVDDPSIAEGNEDRGGSAPAPRPGQGSAAKLVTESGGDRKVLPFHRRRPVQGAIAVLVAAAAAMVVVVRTQPSWWQGLWGPEVDPRFAKLVEAVGEERYIEARLTGGFKYGPLRQVMRGPGDLSGQNLQLLAAAGELQKAAAAANTPENLHALGVAFVLLGEIDQAVDALQRADAMEPDDPAVLADLSAALVARASQSAARGDAGASSSGEDWPRALEAAEQSLAIAPERPEPAFNRALALQALGLATQAKEAWQAYLALDSASPWAEDARRHLARLTQSGRDLNDPDRGPSPSRVDDDGLVPIWRTRQIIETDLLARWAESSRDPSKRLEPPPEFRRLADAGGPSAIAAMARAALAACAESQHACRRFAAHHASYSLAAKLQGQELYGESRVPSAMAVRELDAVGSPLRLSARLLAARAELRSGDAATGREHLTAIVAAPTSEDPLAHAGAQAQLGILAFSSGRLNDVESYYAGQLRMAELSADPTAVLVAHAMLGTFSRYIGDLKTAWYHWASAARYAAQADPRSRHAWLMAMGNACVISGLRHAASDVARAAEANGRHVHPAALVETGALRAKALAMLEDTDAAGAALSEARAALGRIPDEALRTRLELQLLTAAAEAPSGDHHAAKEAALGAIAIVRQQRERLRLPQLFLSLSRASRALGDDSVAERALQEGTAAFEEERGYLNTDQRLSYFDASWGLFSERTERALEAGDIDEALDAFAKSRARTLDESRHVAQTKPSLQLVQNSLGPGDALLLVSQFPRRLAVTFVTGNRYSVHWVALDEVAAQRLARRLEAGPEVERAAAAELFEAMFGPLRDSLATVDALWIVPDVPYYAVPFAALVDEHVGRYLIEMVAIAIAPSVDVVVRRPRLAGKPVTLLAVGVGVSSEGLPALPHATREAADVAGLYGASTVLLDDHATPERVIEEIKTADVAHFGTHAMPNEERPMLSSLAMRDGSGHSAPLFGRDLAAAALGRLRVAVLAACGTGVGMVRRGEGPLSLARALIVGGAGTVIATLTDVPDDASLLLSLAIHRELATGARAMDALRLAQLDVIRQGRPTSAWARTVVVGQGV